MVMVDPSDPLGMGMVKSAKKARARSIPLEKLTRFQRACASFFGQFTLEFFGSSLPGGLTIAEEFGIDERQKPRMVLWRRLLCEDSIRSASQAAQAVGFVRLSARPA